MSYSWILPIFNEAPSLPQLFSEISSAMKGKSYEIIAVNDGSTDETSNQLLKLSTRYKYIKTLHLPNHQGKWEALRQGIKKSQGKIIITSDSDLQDDPREVIRLITKIDQGYDLASGWRRKRSDTWSKVTISYLGNHLCFLLGLGKFHDLNSPLKVYRRKLLDQLPKEGSFLRFSLPFAYKLGYKCVEIEVNHRPRLHEKSKFGLIKYLRIIYDLILIRLLFSGSGRLK